jgi:hypothetical protein
MRLDVEKFGTVLVVFVTIVTLAALMGYGLLKVAGAELHAQAEQVRAGQTPPPVLGLRSQAAAAFAADVAPEASGLDARAFEVDHRADRLLEATAVVALMGMLVAFLGGRPAIDAAQARDPTTPLANTSSNGSV